MPVCKQWFYFAFMSPVLVILLIALYFGVLILIARKTGEDTNEAFFLGNRQSPWYVVAFGMIGASLSGVTFISVPGWVEASRFSYMQMVLGYLAGYAVIALVLLPLYYRLNLTSIYTYLEERLGSEAYRAGAWYFILSRVMGASFRLYLVAMVLKLSVFDKLDLDVPFALIVLVTIGLIWVYTARGGIKTIIWTDTLQTAFMLIAVVVTLWVIGDRMGLDFTGMIQTVKNSDYSRIFFFDDVNDRHFFFKDFLGGAFIAIVMTGLDQDMMQKNLTCRNTGEAQKNMLWFSVILVFVNLLFLSLGALLYIYSETNGIPIPEKADELFPSIAMNGYLGPVVALFFILGLIAAAYSSADSALTALTTSFSVDILNIRKYPPEKQVNIRKRVHIGISLVLVVTIIIFREINDESVISELFTAAGFTYGPLLGMFAFGILTKRKVNRRWVIPVVIAAPVLTYVLKLYSAEWFGGYQLGFELLIINGLLTFTGLYAGSFANEEMPKDVLDTMP